MSEVKSIKVGNGLDRFRNAIKKFNEVNRSMCEFQRINNIYGQCAINSLYLFDSIRHSCKLDVKIECVFVVAQFAGGIPEEFKKNMDMELTPRENYDDADAKLIAGHLVVVIRDEFGNEHIFDPSYESTSMENRMYFRTVAEFMKATSYNSLSDTKPFFKKLVAKFLKFCDLAKMLSTGKYGISDDLNDVADVKYYNDQADYVESHTF
jgi:hypothetical protein